MVDPHTLALFIPIALALNLTPGADMMFCLGQGLRAGPAAGLAASLGITTGGLIHALLAGLGLAALLTSVPMAFEVIRWAGVAYLLVLGVQAIRNPPQLTASGVRPAGTVVAAWRQGVLVNLLNPKVAIFTLALVPQFVDATRGAVLAQFLILGAVLGIGGTVINGLVGVFAGSIGRALTRNMTLANLFRYLTGFVFVALAARLALDRR